MNPIILRALCLLALAANSNPLFGQTLLLDNYSGGDKTVNQTISSTFGDPVPGVFGGNRYILLTKASEASATAISVGQGRLSWTQTSSADYGHVGLGTVTTSESLTGYSGLQIDLVSAPVNPGTLEFNISYYGGPNSVYSVWGLAPLSGVGSVAIPFSSFQVPANFPAIDFNKVHSLSLTFRGSLMTPGTYVFDNFQAVAVPEPAVLWLLVALGVCGFVAHGRRGRKDQAPAKGTSLKQLCP